MAFQIGVLVLHGGSVQLRRNGPYEHVVGKGNGNKAVAMVPRDVTIERLKIFFEGVAPPYRRDAEIAIGAELRRLAEGRGMRFGSLSYISNVPHQEAMAFISGLFRIEDADRGALDRLANSLGRGLADMINLGELAKTDASGRRRNAFGSNVLFSELRSQIGQHFEHCEKAVNLGVGSRLLRNLAGMRRGDLAYESGVCLDYLVILEHCILPNELLNGEIGRISRALGTTGKRMEEKGRETRFIICMANRIDDADELTDRVKKYIDIERAKRD